MVELLASAVGLGEILLFMCVQGTKSYFILEKTCNKDRGTELDYTYGNDTQDFGGRGNKLLDSILKKWNRRFSCPNNLETNNQISAHMSDIQQQASSIVQRLAGKQLGGRRFA
jgi:hypothetical protein